MNKTINILLKTNNSIKKIVVVCSHERSGTHFLINSISKSQPIYSNDPYVDIDYSMYSLYDIYNKDALEEFFWELLKLKCASIVKTHHPYYFFKDLSPEIKKHIVFFYIYRNPIEVLKSFRHFCNTYEPVGPNIRNFKQFMMSQPYGKMMRYQVIQQPNMLYRWKSHILSWFNASALENNVHLLYFNNLRDNYKNIINHINQILEIETLSIDMPNKNNYWKPADLEVDKITTDEIKEIQNYTKNILTENIFKKFFDNLF